MPEAKLVVKLELDTTEAQEKIDALLERLNKALSLKEQLEGAGER